MPRFGDFTGPRTLETNLRAQRIFRMRTQEHKTYKEIAKIVDLSEERVSAIIFYIRLWEKNGLSWRKRQTRRSQGAAARRRR